MQQTVSLFIRENHVQITTQAEQYNLNIKVGELFTQDIPSEYEWETAIMLVEDTIAPIQKYISPEATLIIYDEQLRPLAQQNYLYRESLEQFFQYTSRYNAMPDNLANSKELKGHLLFIREWFHHCGFGLAKLG